LINGDWQPNDGFKIASHKIMKSARVKIKHQAIPDALKKWLLDHQPDDALLNAYAEASFERNQSLEQWFKNECFTCREDLKIKAAVFTLKAYALPSHHGDDMPSFVALSIKNKARDLDEIETDVLAWCTSSHYIIVGTDLHGFGFLYTNVHQMESGLFWFCHPKKFPSISMTFSMMNPQRCVSCYSLSREILSFLREISHIS
jgi:hypothetical protein